MTENKLDAERRQMRRKHIFAVNGEAHFLDVLRILFQAEQFNVTTTNFVPQTFDQIAALKPDLLIIDLALGQEAGWGLLEQLHHEAVTRNIPVILASTTAALLERAQTDVERYGESRVLVKPMNIDALLNAVIELIGPA